MKRYTPLYIPLSVVTIYYAVITFAVWGVLELYPDLAELLPVGGVETLLARQDPSFFEPVQADEHNTFHFGVFVGFLPANRSPSPSQRPGEHRQHRRRQRQKNRHKRTEQSDAGPGADVSRRRIEISRKPDQNCRQQNDLREPIILSV